MATASVMTVANILLNKMLNSVSEDKWKFAETASAHWNAWAWYSTAIAMRRMKMLNNEHMKIEEREIED